MSEKVVDFILQLSKNISEIIIFKGEFKEIESLYLGKKDQIIFKEHPAFSPYKGIRDSREWLAPSISGNFNSFFSFWKKAEKDMKL